MKRIIPLFCILLLAGPALSPQSEYKMNGAGDQYISISLMGMFPLNFNGKLYTGGAAQLGYHRFLNSWFAVGGDIMFGYNPTLGSNILTYVPMTIAFTFQPTVWKLEFPITIGIGTAFESYLNNKYFPAFIFKPEIGAFYRLSESWSLGVESTFVYMPQWYFSHPEYNDYGLFMSAQICARYHF